MRNKYQIIALSAVLALSLGACDMDQYPNDSISTDTAWQTTDDALKFRNGIYSMFKSVNGGIYTYIADYQSDLFNATISYGNRGGDMHRWEFTAGQYDIEDIWANNYITINNCNNIIGNIDNIVPEDEDEKATLSIVKGEALLMRAFCYHTLVLRFAKDYEPSTAATEKGLPLVLEMNPSGKPARSTLEETYAQIKKDIKDARACLSTEGKANSIYFTADVVDALEARVDMYMHNYQEAIQLASKLIAKYPLATDVEEFKNMWLNDEGSEVIYRTFQSVDERANELGVYLQFNTATNTFSPDFVPSQWVLDLYEDGDIRKETFFRKDAITCQEIEVSDVYMLNKYPGNPALKRSTYEYYQMAKIFRAAEAYLIAAESSYAENSETNALNYLNQLRTKRGASALNGLTGEGLFSAIKDEWVREFIGEGQRMNDLKRWHDGVKRHDPQNESILMAGADFTTLTKESNDMRMVWEIPNNDLNSNSNLEGNW